MDTLIDLFEWNAWANAKHRDVLSEIDFEILQQDTPYGRLIDRIVHIFASFKMWHQRMEGESPDSVLTGDDFSSWKDLSHTWEAYDQLLIKYVQNLSPAQLDEEITYQSLNSKWYRRKRRHILIHLTAHPNYHRGQITALLKERAIAQFPSVDPVFYHLTTDDALISDTPFNE
ncbi:MAG: DinB family protein [Candidatus Kariarchaeaceae archaeon]|jgi:uncharacterized damage-inducible protein DinB